MHHDGLVAAAVFTDVFETETAREIEIELHGAELPGAADGVDELDVDFGAVEDGFTGNVFVGDALTVEGSGERALGGFPLLDGAGVIFGMLGIARGELDLVAVEAESVQNGLHEVEAAFDFGFHLITGAKNVGVVLGESAHAQEAVENSRALVAIDGAEFCEAVGKLAITAQAR